MGSSQEKKGIGATGRPEDRHSYSIAHEKSRCPGLGLCVASGSMGRSGERFQGRMGMASQDW